MYVCVLEKFIKLGVPMIARLDSHTEYGSSSFKKLTEVPPPLPPQGRKLKHRLVLHPGTSWPGVTSMDGAGVLYQQQELNIVNV